MRKLLAKPPELESRLQALRLEEEIQAGSFLALNASCQALRAAGECVFKLCNPWAVAAVRDFKCS